MKTKYVIRWHDCNLNKCFWPWIYIKFQLVISQETIISKPEVSVQCWCQHQQKCEVGHLIESNQTIWRNITHTTPVYSPSHKWKFNKVIILTSLRSIKMKQFITLVSLGKWNNVWIGTCKSYIITIYKTYHKEMNSLTDKKY